ncbi:MAG TPA: HD domain-containing phosphohydrolase [Pyrinomonadaceae bacterium]|nr:HD domain-containing phosphohydrolase [Pyrinomonadaceae bacterium]
MLPHVPWGRSVPAAGRWATQAVLLAAAALGREEQPEVYRHVHPHGRSTAILAHSFAGAVCPAAGLSLDEVALGAHLHDFGKYLIPRSLLLKPGPLTDEERAVVSLHPVYGAQILSGLPAVTETVRLVVLYHHERWDGGGYPEGLHGTNIPLAARLVSIADVYASLRARRSYKPTLARGEAAAEMVAMAGRELDPDLTSDFLKFIRC